MCFEVNFIFIFVLNCIHSLRILYVFNWVYSLPQLFPDLTFFPVYPPNFLFSPSFNPSNPIGTANSCGFVGLS